MIKQGLYRHYKGNHYRVIGEATHSEDESKLVVYQPMYGEQGLWVRPVEMFTELVEVEGNQVPRFALVSED